MTQALIISVGKRPEPIVARIAEHRPSFVVFFASEESIESIGLIKVRLEKLPLEATYRLLEALDDPAGKRYASRAGEFKKVQFARNHSWLAHGLTPCQDETYDTLSSLVREILEIEPGPSFPKIEESA